MEEGTGRVEATPQGNQMGLTETNRKQIDQAFRQRAAERRAEETREMAFGAKLNRMPAAKRQRLAESVIQRFPMTGRWWTDGKWKLPHNTFRDLLLQELEQRANNP